MGKQWKQCQTFFFLSFLNLILFFNFIVLVLPYINMNPPQVYTCSPSWTLLPPPSSLPVLSLWVIPVHKHAVSCIDPGLVTYFIYDIIHTSMPFSQIIPPFPSPTESKRLFYTSVSLLLSRIQACIVPEKAMAPHSSTLAWKIPWMEEPGRLQSMGSQRVGHDWETHFHFSLSCIGEGNGNPLQCSCLENPRDGGAWWASIYGVAQSQTWPKWVSSGIQAYCYHLSKFHIYALVYCIGVFLSGLLHSV